MARRRARRNPRNSKGRFVKRARRANPKRKRARSNPSPVRRRRRRARKNPFNAAQRAEWGSMVSLAAKKQAKRRRAGRKAAKTRAKRRPSAGKRKVKRTAKQRAATQKMIRANRHGKVAKRGKRRAKSARRGKRRWRKVSKGIRIVRKYRRRIKGRKRSLSRSVARVQYQRASIIRRAGNKSVVAKAMHLKMNPGFAGVMTAAKVLLPQGAVGAGAMIGLAMVGKQVAARVPASLQASLGSGAKFVPAASTLVLTGIGYVMADKFAPKYKGAVAIGGIIGAIVQGLAAVALSDATGTGLAAKAKAALLGEYTMVGGGGIFHTSGVGEYTMVGGSGRPRGGERDNASEWALNGRDDHTEFAPGEGGVLSGDGIFK
jgi:hypothetical protein